MPDIKSPPGESLSEQQLDDLNVERQRERLERSRSPEDSRAPEGSRQAGQPGGAQDSGDRSRQQGQR